MTMVDKNAFTFCKSEPVDIIHVSVSCVQEQLFWSELKTFIRSTFKTDIVLTDFTILFGLNTGYDYK